MVYLLRLLSCITLKTALNSSNATSNWTFYQPTLPDELR